MEVLLDSLFGAAGDAGATANQKTPSKKDQRGIEALLGEARVDLRGE